MQPNDGAAPVYVVHLVDTEGPLDETLAATFERLDTVFGIRGIPTTRENLVKLQRRELDLGGLEADVARMVAPEALHYMRTWEQVDAMLDRVCDPAYRLLLPDSRGGGWVVNWNCVNHVGYRTNPRRRDMGWHHVFDRYAERIARHPENGDAIHWHFHPMPFDRAANHSGVSFLNSPQLLPGLARGVVDRNWFPRVFRAGFHVERPDIHWFLEQWVPFDYSNQSAPEPEGMENQADLVAGRFGDWRRAPGDWSVYHPAHDDYQTPGACRRVIARCLNMSGRFALLDQDEVDKAFARAQAGQPTILACTNHDFRDMGVEMDRVRGLLREAARRRPEVPFVYAEAVEAMRETLYGPAWRDQSALDLRADIRTVPGAGTMVHVELASGAVFGPQPFLALKTRAGDYLHDNFDVREHGREWFYVLDQDTVPAAEVAAVGVAANDRFGNQSLHVLEVDA